MNDEFNFEEKGIELEMEFYDLLFDYIFELPKAHVDMIPHSGKRRADPSFDVVMDFDYTYWFDVVATYKTKDGYGYRLKTEKKDFREKIEDVKDAFFISKNWIYGKGGIPFLAFKLMTSKDWRWFCIELKEDCYFIDYKGDLRVNKKLIPLCYPLENSYSIIKIYVKSLPLFKNRELWFNQLLQSESARIILPKPKSKKRKKPIEEDIEENVRGYEKIGVSPHFAETGGFFNIDTHGENPYLYGRKRRKRRYKRHRPW